MLIDSVIAKIKKFTGDSVLDEIAIIVLVIAFIESVAQNQLKHSRLYAGMAVYTMVGYLLHYSYHHFELSKVNVMWSSLSIVLATLLGYMLYDEKITQDSIIAMVFALLAVYFINKKQG